MDSDLQKKHAKAMAYMSHRQWEKAEALLKSIAAKHPYYSRLFAVLNDLGTVYYERGNDELAEEYFNQAIKNNENCSEAYSNLGAVYVRQGRLELARKNYSAALEKNADNESALRSIIGVLHKQGKPREMIDYLERLRAALPNDLAVLECLGQVCIALQDMDKAADYFNKILVMDPNYINAYIALGEIADYYCDFSKAIDYFNIAKTKRGDDWGAYNNLGKVMGLMGHHDAALDNYNQALTKQNCKTELVFSNKLLALNYTNLPRQQVYLQHLEINRLFSAPASFHHENSRDPGKKLNIGYVSRDFCEHSVAFFALALISKHDKSKFKVYCYSDGVAEDQITNQFKQHSDVWKNTAALTTEELAKEIHRDSIDILLDLGGHTGNNRLAVFARRPAPVQMTLIGYPNTTGLAAMDYRLTDFFVDPSGEADAFYSEQLIRIPGCFLCYCPPEPGPAIGEIPLKKNGWITFGSFNNFAKITDEILAAWGVVLTQVPGSRLIIKAKLFKDDKVVEEVYARLQRQGLDTARISLLPWMNNIASHLEIYNQIDIALDTFPYNGTTTTFEALFMGVPVVTLAGDRHASRVGLSILANLGLDGQIASTYDEYIDKAVQLALDQERLIQLKTTLRGRLKTSVLTDAVGYTRKIEACLHEIWRLWCASGMNSAAEEANKMSGTNSVNSLENLKSKVHTTLSCIDKADLDGARLNFEEIVADLFQLQRDQILNKTLMIDFNHMIGMLDTLLANFEKNETESIRLILQKDFLPYLSQLDAIKKTGEEKSRKNESTDREKAALIKKIEAFPFWYHKIELPNGIVTPGWAPLDREAYRIPHDLTGKRVLDVGAWDGYWSFEALRRGAREVVAIDDFSDYLGRLENSDRKAWETFDLCKAALGYTDEQCKRIEMSVYDVCESKLGRFDVVFFFGTLYHLRHPLLALDNLSAVCNSEIFVETAILNDYSPFRGGLGNGYSGEQYVAEFYSGKQYGNNDTNWWVPTVHCLIHMVLAAGFTEVKGWKLMDTPLELHQCRGFAHGIKAV